MSRFLATALGLVLLAAVAQAADPVQQPTTGDRKLDGILKAMNTQAQADPDGFLKQLAARHAVPEEDLRQARDAQGLSAGDLFMASFLAKTTQKPVLQVAEEYKKNQGKGWGVMAKEMGIKPGSPAFHELKNGARGQLDQMKNAAKGRQQKMSKESKGQGQGKGKGKEK